MFESLHFLTGGRKIKYSELSGRKHSLNSVRSCTHRERPFDLLLAVPVISPFPHFSGFISYLYTAIKTWRDVSLHWVVSAFIFRLTSLLVSNTISVLLFMVHISPNKLTSSAKTRSLYIPISSCPTWPFWIWNISDLWGLHNRFRLNTFQVA